jgi:hypothetical protein
MEALLDLSQPAQIEVIDRFDPFLPSAIEPMDIVYDDMTDFKEAGVPQGAPTSPVLSNLSLEGSLFKV